MSAFPISRKYPPRRIVYRDAARTLVLRPWSFDDADALIAAVTASLPALRAYMPWSHLPLSREGEFELIARFSADYWAGREYVFGMFDGEGEGSAVLGGLGLHPRTPLNPSALEIGYWCHSAHAGRGWTTLAARVLVALGFDVFGADRVQVMHDESNHASRRVAEKCGFVREGTMRNVVAQVAPELHAHGYQGTPLHRMYGLSPEDLPSLDWLADVRAKVTLVDALGGVRAPRGAP
jgi:RimJ/RimL family protein N-acetyltransferase